MTVCDEPAASTATGSTGGVTVGQVLEPTGLTAFLDTPVADVLTDLGLPSLTAPSIIGLPDLSEFDLPALPTLPGLDPTALVKPIVDLLGTFGSGSLSGAANPVESLGSLAGLLQSGASTILSAISSVGTDWTGKAATAAVGTATRTAGQSEQIAAQGTAMAADVQTAAAIVAAGTAALQGVVAKTVGLLAAAAPTLVTPAGQVAALGIAAEGLTEGLAVVADTRAQLTAPTAHISAVGTPVAVSDAPTALSGDTLSSLLQKAGPLFDAGVQVVGGLLGVSNGSTGSTGTTGTRAAPCCAACEPSTTSPAATTTSGATTTTSTGSDTTASKTTMRTAATVNASGAVPSVAAAEPPIELADRPTTTNASVAPDTTTSSSTTSVSPVSSGVVGGGASMAPVAAMGAARSAESSGLRLADPAAVVAEPAEADPADELSALLAQPFGVDVGLRLDTVRTDLAGSV